jgi:hypothetical protein
VAVTWIVSATAGAGSCGAGWGLSWARAGRAKTAKVTGNASPRKIVNRDIRDLLLMERR